MRDGISTGTATVTGEPFGGGHGETVDRDLCAACIDEPQGALVVQSGPRSVDVRKIDALDAQRAGRLFRVERRKREGERRRGPRSWSRDCRRRCCRECER